MTAPVEVDEAACRRVGAVLNRHAIPIDREDDPPAEIPGDRIGDYFLMLVAICHQTQSLEGRVEGTYRRGWDYLSRKLSEAIRADPRWSEAERWAECTGEDLQALFRDDTSYGDTLSDAAGRAALLRDLGRGMRHRGWRTAKRMYEESGGRIATGSMNLLGLLEGFRAYNDPVRKKSYFFLGLMSNCGRWTYADEEHLGAPVDYHEIRGHLRLGTVVLCDASLRSRILRGQVVTESEDVTIRGAVHEAIRKIAGCTEASSPMILHYLFWNLFRNVCRREEPYCAVCPDDCALPERYEYLLHLAGGERRCPFAESCPSAAASERFLEHVFVTDWY